MAEKIFHEKSPLTSGVTVLPGRPPSADRAADALSNARWWTHEHVWGHRQSLSERAWKMDEKVGRDEEGVRERETTKRGERECSNIPTERCFHPECDCTWEECTDRGWPCGQILV